MSSRIGSISAWTIAALLAFALSACATTGTRLDGTQWKLGGWSVSSLRASEFPITASFKAGRMAGRSAVNSYTGPYTSGPGGAFSVGALISTKMAGPEPAMRAEGIYLTLLGQARSYKAEDGSLTFYDQQGNQSLIFEPAKQ